ncbi:hypothetical protein FH136_10395 [Staphylococcus hominis]|jgi:positive regulator of sigma E activity|uniref:hypothetical protein n=1 Tax=Staphylococcus hominis TaxID=1290 RepID=UPI00066A6BDC|nr:hypothetical protein [Staphylococcus hominis]MCI2923977.1 hypothetical protein [Staphylococcus hominis]
MKKNKKVTINTTFYVINIIMIFIVAALLQKISFIKHHDILGTILYTIIMLISAVVIYNVHLYFLKKFKK